MAIDSYARNLAQKALSQGGGGGTSDYTALENKPKINNVTLQGNVSLNDLGVAEAINKKVGKVVNLGFDGTLSNKVLTFTSTDTYNILEGYNYEIDLGFQAVGQLDDDVTMVINHNSENISFIAPTHRDSTSYATVGEMKQLMRYNVANGYRWLFNAICHVTSSNVKVFLIVPTIVNMAERNDEILNVITNDEILDIQMMTNPTYRGREVKVDDIFICVDDNGYHIGHVYKYTGVVGSEWEDISEIKASDITTDSTHLFTTQTEKNNWNDKIDKSSMGVASGVATLDTDGKIPETQLPSYVDDIIEGNVDSTYTQFTKVGETTPVTPETNKEYYDVTTKITYRWSGSAYVPTGSHLALGETSSTAYAGDKGKKVTDDLNTHISDTSIHVTQADKTNWDSKTSLVIGTTTGTAYDGKLGDDTTNALNSHTTNTNNPHNVTPSQIGLGNVGNYKSVSVDSQTLTQTEISQVLSNLGIDLSLYALNSEKGVANGIATLDSNLKVVLSQIPNEYKRITFITSDNYANLTQAERNNGDVYLVYDATTLTGTIYYLDVSYSGSGGSGGGGDYISKTNTTPYTPLTNYNPATKKYVDDLVGTVGDLLNTINGLVV